MRRFYSVLLSPLLVLLGALLVGTTVTAEEPRLIHKLLFNGRGSQLVRFGDLNGDGTPEVVTAQVAKRQITAVIAMNLQGDTLWQIGKPDPRNYDLFSDLPLQLFDLDSDGKDEVFFIKDGQLTIADGNGVVLKSRPVKGDDALFIQRFGPENALRILVKDRYRQFWIYNSNLKFLWSQIGKLGHFPITINRKGDNKQELMVGYSLYANNGRRLWSIRGKVKRHADGLYHGDMNGDGKLEIAVAASGDSVLIDEDGKILWRKKHKHSQHAILGSFIPNSAPTLQAAFVDRGLDGTIFLFDYSGKQLWKSDPQGRVVILSAVKGWTGDRGEDFILAFRRYYGPPVLINGEGEIVASFPFDPAFNGETYGQHFVQHFDYTGDDREEIFVYDHKELWIYENTDERASTVETLQEHLPNLRISNATFYTGEH